MEPNAALSEASVGIVQRRGVRDIERLRAEFEVDALREDENVFPIIKSAS